MSTKRPEFFRALISQGAANIQSFSIGLRLGAVQAMGVNKSHCRGSGPVFKLCLFHDIVDYPNIVPI